MEAIRLNANEKSILRDLAIYDYSDRLLGQVIADFRAACAYEDAAVRAILAALALVEPVGDLRRSSPRFPQLRVGIATGTVVVDEGASREHVSANAVARFRRIGCQIHGRRRLGVFRLP